MTSDKAKVIIEKLLEVVSDHNQILTRHVHEIRDLKAQVRDLTERVLKLEGIGRV